VRIHEFFGFTRALFSGNRKSVIALLILAAFVGVIGMGTSFGAGKFPEKPVTIIVHAAAGGGSDMFARAIAAAVD
jgi:tripartite-type tricarboxylate transporter receptor subunit TctC